jgi:hypothetical protein
MDTEERKKAVNELKEICQEIGCSGLDPDMCQNRPQNCSIIRKLIYAGTVKVRRSKCSA